MKGVELFGLILGGGTFIAVASAALLGGCGDSTEMVVPGGEGGTAYPGDPCEPEGAVDDCYPGSPTTRGVGECRLGTSRCSDGLWGECEGYQLPSAESCDGLDQNCNGVADDGCAVGGAGGGAAGGAAGGAGQGGGDGGGGAAATLRLYHRSFTSGTSSFQAVSAADAWSGANAPPAETVVAAETSYGTAEPWLFVISSTGYVYLRRGASWLVPQPFATTFVGLGAADVNTLTIWQAESGGAQSFQLTARAAGAQKLAYDFTVELPAFTVSAAPTNPIVIPDEADPAAPPHYMVDMDWQFSHQTAHLGTAHWVLFYLQCGANAYLLDGGSFEWADLGPAGQSSLWGADPSLGPESGTVRAAWLEGNELYLLAP